MKNTQIQNWENVQLIWINLSGNRIQGAIYFLTMKLMRLHKKSRTDAMKILMKMTVKLLEPTRKMKQMQCRAGSF